MWPRSAGKRNKEKSKATPHNCVFVLRRIFSANSACRIARCCPKAPGSMRIRALFCGRKMRMASADRGTYGFSGPERQLPSGFPPTGAGWQADPSALPVVGSPLEKREDPPGAPACFSPGRGRRLMPGKDNHAVKGGAVYLAGMRALGSGCLENLQNIAFEVERLLGQERSRVIA